MADAEDYTGMRLDATSVRVLAHSLRSRLLSQLRVEGPATATELAEVLHTNTGATSYHLRRLESVGLVTDTGEGEGRRRLWRASTTFHAFDPSEFREDDDAAAAVGWLQRDYVRRLAAGAEDWLDAADQWPAAWVDASGLNDTFVVVTAEQLTALQAELTELLGRYRTVGEADEAARRVQLWTFARPNDLRPPSPQEDPADDDAAADDRP